MTNTIDLMLRALDVGFDRRKLLFTVLFMILSLLIFGVFALPGALLLNDSAPSGLRIMLIIFLFGIGYILLLMMGGLLQGGLSYMAVTQLTTGLRVGLGPALAYTFRRALSFGFAPFVPLVLTLIVLFVEVVVLLPGRVAALSSIWPALLFYPLLLLNVLVALGLLVGGMLLCPALVAGPKSLPSAVRDVLGLLRRSPVRIVVAIALGVIAFLFAYVLLLALLFMAAFLTASATAIGAGTMPGFPTITPPGIGGFNQDLNIAANGVGDLLFGLLTVIFYILFATIPVTLFNALGAAVYLSVSNTPLQSAATTPAPPTPTGEQQTGTYRSA